MTLNINYRNIRSNFEKSWIPKGPKLVGFFFGRPGHIRRLNFVENLARRADYLLLWATKVLITCSFFNFKAKISRFLGYLYYWSVPSIIFSSNSCCWFLLRIYNNWQLLQRQTFTIKLATMSNFLNFYFFIFNIFILDVTCLGCKNGPCKCGAIRVLHVCTWIQYILICWQCFWVSLSLEWWVIGRQFCPFLYFYMHNPFLG